MSSEEKKDPPGMGDPRVLGEHDDDEDDDAEESEDSCEIMIDGEAPQLVLRSRVQEAYTELKDIMRERKDSWFTAFGRNFTRNGKKPWRIITHVVTGGIVTIGVTLLTGDPLFGLTTGSAFGITAPPAVSTTRLRRSRLSEHRRSYPDVPEFHDLWAVTAYEFVLMTRGYHLRAQAIHRLRKLASQLGNEPKKADAALRTASSFVDLLSAWHPHLVEIDRVMFEYQANSMEIYADAEGQDAIRQIQPLKDGLYDWLILDPEVIVPGKEQELFERDIYEIASFQDMSDAIDPYSALQREQEREE